MFGGGSFVFVPTTSSLDANSTGYRAWLPIGPLGRSAWLCSVSFRGKLWIFFGLLEHRAENKWIIFGLFKRTRSFHMFGFFYWQRKTSVTSRTFSDRLKTEKAVFSPNQCYIFCNQIVFLETSHVRSKAYRRATKRYVKKAPNYLLAHLPPRLVRQTAKIK